MKIKDIKLSSRERILTGLTLIVAIFGFFKYWYLPKQEDMRQAQSALTQVQSDLEKNKTQLDELKLKQAKLSAFSPDDDKAHSIGRLFDGFVEAAHRSEVQVKRMRQDKSEETEYLRVAHIEMQVESNFLKLGHFLDQVEHSPIATEVSQISIDRVDDDLKLMRVDLNLKSYFRKGQQ